MCAEKMGITREAQDEHAIASVERARAATVAGLVDWEVAPVEVAGPKGGPPLVVKEARRGRGERREGKWEGGCCCVRQPALPSFLILLSSTLFFFFSRRTRPSQR